MNRILDRFDIIHMWFFHDLMCPLCPHNYGYQVKRWIEFHLL